MLAQKSLVFHQTDLLGRCGWAQDYWDTRGTPGHQRHKRQWDTRDTGTPVETTDIGTLEAPHTPGHQRHTGTLDTPHTCTPEAQDTRGTTYTHTRDTGH